MVINTKLTDTTNNNSVKTGEDFTYLDSKISSDNGTAKDTQARLSKVRSALQD
jgi:hypothetical protein